MRERGKKLVLDSLLQKLRFYGEEKKRFFKKKMSRKRRRKGKTMREKRIRWHMPCQKSQKKKETTPKRQEIIVLMHVVLFFFIFCLLLSFFCFFFVPPSFVDFGSHVCLLFYLLRSNYPKQKKTFQKSEMKRIS